MAELEDMPWYRSEVAAHTGDGTRASAGLSAYARFRSRGLERSEAVWRTYQDGVQRIDCPACGAEVVLIKQQRQGLALDPQRLLEHCCGGISDEYPLPPSREALEILLGSPTLITENVDLAVIIAAGAEDELTMSVRDQLFARIRTLAYDGYPDMALDLLGRLNRRCPKLGQVVRDSCLAVLTVAPQASLSRLVRSGERARQLMAPKAEMLVAAIRHRESNAGQRPLGETLLSIREECWIENDQRALDEWAWSTDLLELSELRRMLVQSLCWGRPSEKQDLRQRIVLSGEYASVVEWIREAYEEHRGKDAQSLAGAAMDAGQHHRADQIAEIAALHGDKHLQLEMHIARSARDWEDLRAVRRHIADGRTSSARGIMIRFGRRRPDILRALAAVMFERGSAVEARLWTQVFASESGDALAACLLATEHQYHALSIQLFKESTWTDTQERLRALRTLSRASSVRHAHGAALFVATGLEANDLETTQIAVACLAVHQVGPETFAAIERCYKSGYPNGARFLIFAAERRSGVDDYIRDMATIAYQFDDVRGIHQLFGRVRLRGLSPYRATMLLHLARKERDVFGFDLLRKRLLKHGDRRIRTKAKSVSRPTKSRRFERPTDLWPIPGLELNTWAVRTVRRDAKVATYASHADSASHRVMDTSPYDDDALPYGAPTDLGDPRFGHRSQIEWGTFAHGISSEEFLSETTDDDHEWRGQDRYF